MPENSDMDNGLLSRYTALSANAHSTTVKVSVFM